MLLSLVVISNVLDRAYPGFLDCRSDFGSLWVWVGCPGSALLLQFDIDFCLLIFELDVGFVLLDSWVMRRSIWIFTDVINWLSLFGFFSPLNLFFDSTVEQLDQTLL